MSLNALSYCEGETSTCFKEFCEAQVKVDSSIAAVALIENDSLPAIGDTLTLSTSVTPITIDETNYAETLEQWIRDKQFECAGGGQNYFFFTQGVLKGGKRAKPTQVFSENAASYTPSQHQRYETTAELMFEQNMLPYTTNFYKIMKRASNISVIYFFKQGALPIDGNGGVKVSVTGAGYEVVGDTNENIKGSVDLAEKGDTHPEFYFVTTPNDFLKKLSKSTQFTFGEATHTVLAEAACGSKGQCKAYTVAPSTAFTYTPVVNELVSCGTFSLKQNCTDNIAVGVDIAIDSSTGVITSAGLDAGKYKFTVYVTNDCCIEGSQCFILDVK